MKLIVPERFMVMLAFVCFFATTLSAQQAERLRERVAAIASGANVAARRSAIIDTLKASAIDYRLEGFTLQGSTGTNITVNLVATNATRIVLLGAHYDRVSVGQGAVDNAASCAILLDLLSAFKAQPMRTYSVTAVFFDLEERGLIGSRAYFQTNRAARPDQAINLDIFGYGDTLFVNPSVTNGPLIIALRQAAKALSFPIREVTSGAGYPPGDDRSMMAAGLETLGMALIDGTEIDSIVGRLSGAPPRILTIIHSPGDTTDKIRPEEMAKAFPVLEATIRRLDQP